MLRNAHAVGMGIIAEWASGFPGYQGRLSRRVATLAEVLRDHACGTYAVGKWHLGPLTEATAAWSITAEVETPLGGAALPARRPDPPGPGGRALDSGSELPVMLADARAALELITAIYHAARTRQPVRLPIDHTHSLYEGWQLSGRA